MGLQPAAKFLNNECSLLQKLHNNSGGKVYHLLLFFDVWPTNKSTITDVALCHKKVGRPWYKEKVLRHCAPLKKQKYVTYEYMDCCTITDLSL